MPKSNIAARKAKSNDNESKAPDTSGTLAEKPKAAAKKIAQRRRRPRRAAKRKASVRPRGKAAVQKSDLKSRHSRRGRRYTPAERTRILATARREGLTGAKVAERFGVSTVTYYLWRKKSGKTRNRLVRRRGRPAGSGRMAERALSLADSIRSEVRAQIARMLPEIVSSEIGGVFGGGRSGSRRRRRS